MIKKFRLFESLYEAAQTKETIIKKVKDTVGDVYYIPDFQEISRPDEPDQIQYLFSDKEGHSFTLNFTEDTGILYSIDFWLPHSTKAESTLYVVGQDLDRIISLLPKMMKSPHPQTVRESEDVASEPVVLEKPADTVQKSGDDKVDKIDKELPEYKYQDPKTIFEDMRKYVKMVIKGIQPSLLVTGMPGVGKTYITSDEIKKAGLEKGKDWVKVKGKTTAAALYISLYRNNGKLIIYDDCDSVFKDPNAINTLKGALDSEDDERDITWDISREIKDPMNGEVVPRSFKFTGRVIFLSNLAQKAVDPAIKSRAFVLEVALSPSDMIEYIEDLLPKVMPEESMALKNSALNTIKSVEKVNKKVQLNMRTLLKAVKILKEVPDLGDARRMIVQQCSYE
jgi:hypothetical protein